MLLNVRVHLDFKSFPNVHEPRTEALIQVLLDGCVGYERVSRVTLKLPQAPAKYMHHRCRSSIAQGLCGLPMAMPWHFMLDEPTPFLGAKIRKLPPNLKQRFNEFTERLWLLGLRVTDRL